MRKICYNILKIVMVVFFVLLMTLQSFAATTNYLFDGQMSITDSVGNGGGTPESYIITAKGSLLSKKTNNITIANETDVDAIIEFTYSVSSANSFTIAGAAASTSGSYSAKVSAGGNITIVLQSKSGFSDTTATLTFANITYTPEVESSDITFDFDSSLGMVTADGEEVNSGSTITVDESGAEIVATPATGAVFVGWVDENGKIISKKSSYTQQSIGNITVRALFSKNTPYFMVDSFYICSDLNEAASKGDNLVLVCDGDLLEGDYVIPEGVTLLIPFDDDNTLYTAEPPGLSKADIGNYKSPEAYRTLTMKSNANIKVEGAISLSAKHFAAGGGKSDSGSPVGNVSFIKMEKDSSITVENGGKLYAWGYITGNGTVSVKSGAEVFECFQVTDFRGGNQTISMKNGVFLFSQYYIQNIEVPMTIYSGAKEITRTSVCMSGTTVASSSVNFFGQTNAMFNLTDGYVVKKYDGSTDRLIVELNGDMSISPVKMKISLYTVDSSQYELPVNSNITINVKEGSNVYIEQDISLLPGSVINIEEGATGTLKSGSSIYVYDADEWGGYCGPSNSKLIPLTYAPGRTYTRTVADLEDAKVNINGELDLSEGYVYTTEGGANVMSEGTGKVSMIQGVEKVTYQLDQKNGTYAQIPITTGQLKNADGTYTEPAVLEDCCATYIYSNGKWIPKKVTNTNYSISNESIVINTSLILDIPTDTQIIIATYNSEMKLLESSYKTAATLEEITFSSADVAMIKVFAWDGVSVMSPISLVEEIEL